jgi:hypothetical protein
MYFPKSQIKSNLFTNGNEYILSTTQQEYKGYYYEISNGRKYTGKTPQDGQNILLIPLIKQQSIDPLIDPSIPTTSNTIYSINSNISKSLPNRSLPQYNPTLPTQKDISLGVFQRFFCKKNNELIYMEINQSTYSQLKSKSSQIAWDLYTPIDTLWYIKGDREKVYNTNKNLISLIEQKQKWYGFSQYFKEDFSKYYVGE